MLAVLTECRTCAGAQSSVSYISSSCTPRPAARLACYMRLALSCWQIDSAFNMIYKQSSLECLSMQSRFNFLKKHGWYTGSAPKVYLERGQPNWFWRSCLVKWHSTAVEVRATCAGNILAMSTHQGAHTAQPVAR